ncbi:MAG: E3 binding domain-containing protein, partial [Theionarchaea archaeon]|nr:E3 binding domain-containing protein [Theionarchaea archaeon]
MKMVMPKMGMTMEEGTIVEWKRREGEFVQKGEIILEIMTNKVNIEVEAPASGYLKILRGVDEVVPVGEIIALVEEAPEPAEREVTPHVAEEVPWKEEKPTAVGLEREVVEISAHKERIPASPRARKVAEDHGVLLENVRGTGPDGAVTEEDVLNYVGEEKPSGVAEPGSFAVSPLAERIARERGVDLSTVRGTGLDGKITKEDVLRYLEEGERQPPKMEEEWEPEKPERERMEKEWEPEKPGIEESPEIEIEREIEKPEIKPEPVTQPPAAQPEYTPAEPERHIEKPPVPPEKPLKPELEGKIIPLTGIRKLTAERMSRSKREAPHLTLSMDVDMTEAANLKTSLSVTYTDILVKAVALALRKHPHL